MTLELVIDHLWQSTLVAAAVAGLTLIFRRAHAHTRYWIWFAASLKFLIPFAALTSIGAQLGWREALPSASSEWAQIIETLRLPFAASQVGLALPGATRTSGIDPTALAVTIWILGCVAVVTVWLLRWRRVSAAARAGTPIVSGRVNDAFRRLESRSALPLISSETALEPGVFGILRPVLLWPRDMDVRLDDAQVQAILAHELAHVHRRDNLTAAVHMLVEAVFWFHPMVWWIGTRLVDERERACDEEVVRLGSEPHVYAESILRTCQFYVESPLPCVPGVTGSDLKKRIERIMAHRPAHSLSAWSKTLLVTAATVTLASPVAVGALTVPRAAVLTRTLATDTQRFEVTTVKANTTGAMRVTMQMLPGGTYDASNVTLESMIRMAYRLQEMQLAGGPAWIYTNRFDIQAKSAAGSMPSEFGRRMQSLLADRFKLTLHTETRELPVYALVLADRDGGRGPRLAAAAVDCAALAREQANITARGGTPPVPVPQKPGERPACGTITGPGRLTGGGATMEQLAASLSQYTGRMVFDRTGMSGNFDYDLEFAHNPALRGRGPGGGLPGPPEPATPADPGRGSIFTAVQAQLGLRLDSQRSPVDVLVIDSAEQPTEN